jgi:hypothetical protein
MYPSLRKGTGLLEAEAMSGEDVSSALLSQQAALNLVVKFSWWR